MRWHPAATAKARWNEPDEPIRSDPPLLPPHLAELATLPEPRSIDPLSFHTPTPADLPEIAELAALGWALLAWDQRMLSPVWPVSDRGWMPDRVPKFAVHHHPDGSAWVESLTRLQERYLGEDEADWWRPLELPPPPRGRLWFVRSPWPTHTVPELWTQISQRAIELSPDDPFAALAPSASELLGST